MQDGESKKRKKVSISQKAIIYDPEKNKFLLVKVNDAIYEWYCNNRGPWEFIGGGLDEGESINNSFLREIKEEAGDIKLSIVNIVAADEFEAPSGNKIVLGYLANYLGGEIKISDEHSEYAWKSAEEISKNKEYKQWIKDFIGQASKYLEKNNALESWKRCQADFENYKKDQARHQEEFRKYAKMDVIEQILPVVDNFEASLAHVPAHSKENKWVEGIVYIKKQLEDILKNNDIEEIEVKAGDKFNPEIHEAVGGDGKKQKVTKVIQKGYKLNGRIVRAARVEVE